MARQDVEAWIPEEYGSEVLQRITQTSAIEANAHSVPMNAPVRHYPRSGAMNVGLVNKGSAYNEETHVADDVLLVTQKFGSAFRVAEEDEEDSLVQVINNAYREWGISYAKALDNSSLAVTASKNTSGCKYDSLYYLLTQADSTLGYEANDNIIKTAGDLTYVQCSRVLGIYEQSDYYDPAKALVIAHPSYRENFRGVLDDNGRPIFVESSNGDSAGGASNPDKLFGIPISWSLGARTSATVTSAPTGNPLLTIGNRDFLLLGKRSGPESIYISGRDGLSALTDESILKMRARRAFAAGHPKAFAMLERTTA